MCLIGGDDKIDAVQEMVNNNVQAEEQENQNDYELDSRINHHVEMK